MSSCDKKLYHLRFIAAEIWKSRFEIPNVIFFSLTESVYLAICVDNTTCHFTSKIYVTNGTTKLTCPWSREMVIISKDKLQYVHVLHVYVYSEFNWSGIQCPFLLALTSLCFVQIIYIYTGYVVFQKKIIFANWKVWLSKI